MTPRIALLCSLSWMCAACVSSGTYDALRRDKGAVDGELTSLRQAHAGTLSELDATRKQRDTAIADATAAHGTNTALQRELAAAKAANDAERARLQQQLADLAKQAQALQVGKSEAIRHLKAQNDELQARYQAETARLAAEDAAARKAAAAREDELNARIAALEGDKAKIQAALQRMADQQQSIERDLKGEIEAGRITLQKFRNKLIINVDTEIAFESGQDALKPEVKSALQRIAAVLLDYPEYDVRIEGHTDNVPISTVRFPNNWYLSTARAVAVLQYLLDTAKVPAERLSAVGYGEFHPAAPNDTPESRRRNRRVEIVVAPRQDVQVVDGAARPTAP